MRILIEMNVIVAGSRNITDYRIVKNVLGGLDWSIDLILSGHANGVDKLAERWARESGIEVNKYPAYWDKYGKKAGYVRNLKMAQRADALIAIWDGESKGTKMMIDIALDEKIKFIYVVIPWGW